MTVPRIAVGVVAVMVLAASLIAIYRGSGREGRQIADLKLATLTGHLGQTVVIVTDTGARVRLPKEIAGTLTSVDRRGVGIKTAGGREQFIPLGGVHALEDVSGRTIDAWR